MGSKFMKQIERLTGLLPVYYMSEVEARPW